MMHWASSGWLVDRSETTVSADGADDTSLPAAQSSALVLGLVNNLVHDLQLGGDKNPRQSRCAHCQKSSLVFCYFCGPLWAVSCPVVLCCVEVLQQLLFLGGWWLLIWLEEHVDDLFELRSTGGQRHASRVDRRGPPTFSQDVSSPLHWLWL